MNLVRWFLGLFARALPKTVAAQGPPDEIGPEDLCQLLEGVTARQWRVATYDELPKDSTDCGFVLCRVEEDLSVQVFVIADPIRKRHGPKLMAEGQGGEFLSLGDNVGELCEEPDVLSVLKGEISVGQFCWRARRQLIA